LMADESLIPRNRHTSGYQTTIRLSPD
jgi:hypothetical protein